MADGGGEKSVGTVDATVMAVDELDQRTPTAVASAVAASVAADTAPVESSSSAVIATCSGTEAPSLAIPEAVLAAIIAGTAVPSAGPSTTATTAGTGSRSGSATGSTRSKRQELSFAERIQVIFARCGGKSMRQLASEFGCGKTQILNILGQRESYLREWEEKQGPSNPHISARKRRSRRTGNEETNRRVWDWYQNQKSQGVRVTGPMLQREARSIARTLNIANFAASNGWLDSFRRLHNIVSYY